MPHVRHRYEQQHRELRKRQKRAIDVVLETTERFLDWPDEHTFSKADLWQQADERQFRGALSNLRTFQRLEERGYGDLLLARYPSLSKYFAEFLHLPFAAEQGNASLLDAIAMIRQLDAGTLAPVEASWAALMVLYTACLRYGAPTALISDSGGAYISNAFEAVLIASTLTTRPLSVAKAKAISISWKHTLTFSAACTTTSLR